MSWRTKVVVLVPPLLLPPPPLPPRRRLLLLLVLGPVPVRVAVVLVLQKEATAMKQSSREHSASRTVNT